MRLLLLFVITLPFMEAAKESFDRSSLRIDCRTVLCRRPDCENPVTPEGQCCPECPKKMCPYECENYFDGCNTCKCSEYGPVCTLKYCEKYEQPACLDCRDNFELVACSACSRTCANPNPLCKTECVLPPKCVCRAPNVLNDKGDCVPSSECECEDPLADFFEAGPCIGECGQGECQFIQPGPPGCYCRDPVGMRMLNGKCVLKEECVKCSKPNMEYLQYGLEDYRRCFNEEPRALTEEDSPLKPGCYCEPGFVRNAQGNCIRTTDCPALCPKGCSRFFDGCNECQCQNGVAGCTKRGCLEWQHPTCLECEDPLASYTDYGPCVSQCGYPPCAFIKPDVPGCYCKDPMNMRLSDEKCVYEKDCPIDCSTVDCAEPKCDIGAPYVPEGECCPVCPDCTAAFCQSCDSLCPNPFGSSKCITEPGECCPTKCCNNPPDCPALRCASRTCPDGVTTWGCTNKCYITIKNECSGFTPESVCKEGTACGENQHFESCGTACPGTCANKDDGPRMCILSCKPGCFCDRGYVRDSDGNCIREKDCPTTTTSQGPCQDEHRRCSRRKCNRHSWWKGRCKKTCGGCQ